MATRDETPTEETTADERTADETAHEATVEEATAAKIRWDVIIALIPEVPKLLTIVCVVVAIAVFYEPVRTYLVSSVTKVEIFGVTAEFNKEQFQNLVVANNSDDELERIFRSVNTRLRHVLPLVAGGKILWIDDNHPTQNAREREVVRSLGVVVDIAKNDEEAMDLLMQKTLRERHADDPTNSEEFVPIRQYDIVISDNTRGGKSKAGEEFFSKVSNQFDDVKLILYSASYKPDGKRANYIFGMTDRYDDLLHLILDALERRGSVASVANRPADRADQSPGSDGTESGRNPRSATPESARSTEPPQRRIDATSR